MRTFSKKQKLAAAVLGAGVIAVAGGGIAYAYWSSSGTGTGTASTGTNTHFTVTTAAATGGPLSPAGPSETIQYTVKNPDSGSEKLNQVVVKVANSDGSAWTAVAGCSADDFQIGNAAAGAAWTDASLAGVLTSLQSVTGTITISMVDTGSNQDACKSLSAVPLYLFAS